MSSLRKTRKIFSKIYDEYVDKIYRFIFVKVNSQEVTEDLCSETFLRCWKIFKEDQNKIENIQAFLYQIARNLVTDHYREKGKTQIVSVDYVPITDPGTDLEEESRNNSDFNMVKLALNGLKENHQEVIIWYYVDDLSVSEIADLTSKSEGAVRVMIHRALNNLKIELENKEEV